MTSIGTQLNNCYGPNRLGESEKFNEKDSEKVVKICSNFNGSP